MVTNTLRTISAVLCCLMLSGCSHQRYKVSTIEHLINGTTIAQIDEEFIIDTELFKSGKKAKGIRDFVFLEDEQGNIVNEGGAFIAYANVFFEDETGPTIMCFTSADGKTWEVANEGKSVLSTQILGINELGSSIGSVIKLNNGQYYLYFSGLSSRNDRVGYYLYNLSISSNWYHFETLETPLIDENEFVDIQHIGLPYTCVGKDGRFYMTCESISNGEYSIYGAVSENGREFTPLNDGNAVLLNDEIAWGSGGCANPKIFSASEGVFFLGFNAFSQEDKQDQWKLGAAKLTVEGTKAKVTNITASPIIGQDVFNMSRIESTYIVVDKTIGNYIYFFATPTFDAVYGAAIYRAQLI